MRNWLTTLSLNSAATIVTKVTPRREPHRKHSLYCCAIVAVICVYRYVT
jgi:hypothetical protein